MAWIYLIIAGLLEVVWASWLKKTDGFTKLGPSLITIGVMCVSFYLLGLALKTLPTGTGYAVWVGIGAEPSLSPLLSCSKLSVVPQGASKSAFKSPGHSF